jgi:hypothetical protein
MPQRGAWLRPPERALADALDQLEAGVPLNWTQIEDDPELATLSGLQTAAQECRSRYTPVPPELSAGLLADLTARLPQPKPEPAKKQPETPAGFTGKVYVPAQAEENVPALTFNILPWAGAAGVVVLLLLIMWAAGVFSKPKAAAGLSFSWIDVRQNDQTISHSQRPADWKPMQCALLEGGDPQAGRVFLRLTDQDQIRATAGSLVEFLPRKLAEPYSNTLTLLDGGISPCAETIPDPSDAGAIVRLTYHSSVRRSRTASEGSTITIFESRGQPASIDVSTGTWEEVSVGESHGVYWRGGPYRDMEGTPWIGDVSVLIVERGDRVTTFIGQNNQGATKDMLLQIVSQMEQVRNGVGSGAPPTFSWVDFTRDNQLVSPKQPPSGWELPKCAATQTPDTFYRFFRRVGGVGLASSYVTYPVLSVPTAEVQTATSTLTLRNARASVSPCMPDTFIQNDPGAIIKINYTGELIMDRLGRSIRFTQFETNRIPITFELGNGTWEESRPGSDHMLYWTGADYHDPEGTLWPNDTNALLIERGDYTILLLGTQDGGLTQEVLLMLASLLK